MRKWVKMQYDMHMHIIVSLRDICGLRFNSSDDGYIGFGLRGCLQDSILFYSTNIEFGYEYAMN